MHECLCNNLYMGHGHEVELESVDAATAGSVAQTMQALATPSRVMILSRLAVEVGMSQPAVSQQLRVLRYLGIVVGNRDGRRVVYELHDDHVRALLNEAVSHVEHMRLGIRDHAAARPAPAQVTA